MQRKLIVPVLILLVVGLTACATTTEEVTIVVDDPWVRPSPLEGGNGGGFMTLTNHSGEDDALIGAEADFANMVEIHETVMGDNDTMTMQPVDRIELPQGETVSLAPGGYHVMLMGIQEPLQPGTTVKVTLIFEKAGRFEVPFQVREQ